MFERIDELSREEVESWERAGDGDGLTPAQRARLDSIRTGLDRCHGRLLQRVEPRAGGGTPSSDQP